MTPASDAWKLESAAPEAVESADVCVKVRQALLTLTPREERAIRLRYFEGATYHEIADAFDVCVERARQITEKALRKLKHPSRSRMLLAAFIGTLPYGRYPPAEPEPTPSEAQEIARRLRELQSHIEDTKRRKTQQEEWLANYRAKQRLDWWEVRPRTQPVARQHPTMGEGRCLIRIVRTVAATTEGEMIIMHLGETWLVDEQHRDDLVALGYAVIA